MMSNENEKVNTPEFLHQVFQDFNKVLNYDIERHKKRELSPLYPKFASFYSGFKTNKEYKNHILKILKSFADPTYKEHTSFLVFVTKLIKIIEEKDNRIFDLMREIVHHKSNLNGIILEGNISRIEEDIFLHLDNPFAKQIQIELQKKIPKGKSAANKYKALAYCFRAFEEVNPYYKEIQVLTFMEVNNQSSLSNWRRKKSNLELFLKLKANVPPDVLDRLISEVRIFLSDPKNHTAYKIKTPIPGFTDILPPSEIEKKGPNEKQNRKGKQTK